MKFYSQGRPSGLETARTIHQDATIEDIATIAVPSTLNNTIERMGKADAFKTHDLIHGALAKTRAKTLASTLMTTIARNRIKVHFVSHVGTPDIKICLLAILLTRVQ